MTQQQAAPPPSSNTLNVQVKVHRDASPNKSQQFQQPSNTATSAQQLPKAAASSSLMTQQQQKAVSAVQPLPSSPRHPPPIAQHNMYQEHQAPNTPSQYSSHQPPQNSFANNSLSHSAAAAPSSIAASQPNPPQQPRKTSCDTMPYSSTNRRQPVIAPYVANSAGKQQQRELFAQQLQQQPAYGGASAISPNQPSNFYSDPSVRDAEVISPQRRQPVPLSDIGGKCFNLCTTGRER